MSIVSYCCGKCRLCIAVRLINSASEYWMMSRLNRSLANTPLRATKCWQFVIILYTWYSMSDHSGNIKSIIFMIFKAVENVLFDQCYTVEGLSIFIKRLCWWILFSFWQAVSITPFIICCCDHTPGNIQVYPLCLWTTLTVSVVAWLNG